MFGYYESDKVLCVCVCLIGRASERERDRERREISSKGTYGQEIFVLIKIVCMWCSLCVDVVILCIWLQWLGSESLWRA